MLVLLIVSHSISAKAQVSTTAERLWRVPLGHDGAYVQVLIGSSKTARARAVLLLLPGGDGRIALDFTGRPTRLPNDFVVRTRRTWHKAGYLTALMDAPSDRQKPPGLLAGYRATKQHAMREIEKTVALLTSTFRVPVFVLGTGRGTVSAANAAQRLRGKLAGTALVAAISRPNQRGASLRAVGLEAITTPTLFVHHVNDRCRMTPAHAARTAFEAMHRAGLAVRWATVSGGRRGLEPCSGKSHHGLWKAEGQALGHLRSWLRRHLKGQS